jgi:hypothetical protein
MRHPLAVGDGTLDAVGAGIGRFDHVDWRLIGLAVTVHSPG